MTKERLSVARLQRMLRLALLVLAGFALTACGGSEERGYADNAPPADPGPPQYGGHISVALEGETNNWLPGTGNMVAPAALSVAVALFDPLVRIDHEGRYRPFLAESIVPNDSYDIWTMRLRPGVTFHDGTPLNAEAIKWNFDNLHKRPGSVTLGSIRDVSHVEIVDELTVEYHLTKTMVSFPDILTRASGWPVSPTAVQRFGADAGMNPVGTGPFMLESWRRDDRLVLRRNDNYWQAGQPYLDGITFRPLPDEDARLASLVSRDMDVIQTLRQHIVDRLRRTPGIHLYEQIGDSSGSAIFNTRRPPVDDARIRRSLAYALDPEALVDVLGGRGITPVQTQYFNQESPWYSERVAEMWPRNNPERAIELMQEYMNDPNRSDGRAVGEPVSIELLCLPEQSLIDLSQMYQAFWRGVGYDVRLRQVEQATQVQSAIAGDYMVSCWRSGNEQDPYIILSSDFGPPDEQPLNYTNFTHPELDELIDALGREPEFEKRYEIAEQIMMLFAREVPNTWTGATPGAIAVRPEVRNIRDWVFPDGTPGNGIPQGQVTWAQIWLAE